MDDIRDFCDKKKHFSPSMYSYYRASQSDEHEKTASPNTFGTELSSTITRAFKRITAADDDSDFMTSVYCFPEEACEYAHDRMIQTFDRMNPNGPTGAQLYKQFQRKYMDDILQELVRDIETSKSTKVIGGAEKVILWAGEKGIGKTTLLNYIFHRNKVPFELSRIVWIRFSVFLRNENRNIDNIKLRFNAKVISIIKNYYKKYIDIDSLAVRRQIWEDALPKSKPSMEPEKLKARLDELESNAEEYARKLIKYFYSIGWGFVFILDNIDQHDDSNITKDIISFAAQLSRHPVRCVVIVVARTETILDNISFFQDQNHIFERKTYIPHPNFEELFQKRVNYINQRLTGQEKLNRVPNTELSFTDGEIATSFITYYLTPFEKSRDKFLIAELANHNIRDMFEMIKGLMKTHIADCTTEPLNNLIRKKTKRVEASLERGYTEESLRQHLVIWGLMLRNNSLFYKNKTDKTWLINIYDIISDADSFFLKRLIIDFLAWKKDKGIVYVYDNQLEDVFLKEMDFSEGDFAQCLQVLLDKKNTSPLIASIRDGHSVKYKITPKGYVYSKYICDLYTYIELIIEDCKLPLKNANNNQRGIDIKLIPFEPLTEINEEKRRNLFRNYFIEKRKQVFEFMDFLQCREFAEKNNHNDFFSAKEGFHGEFFPSFRANILGQSRKIANALGISDD